MNGPKCGVLDVLPCDRHAVRSFGFHLAMDTLAVRLALPPVGCAEDFHLQVSAPCRAHHHEKSPGEPGL